MNSQKPQELPKIGYLVHYPDTKHPTDKFRMDIYLSSQPTEKHFDVLKVSIPVLSPQDSNLKVLHPWEFEREFKACAGVVVLEDRKGKKVEALTFGGQLSIESREHQTICTLVSSAPILLASETAPLQSLFVEEVEILLAEQRAKGSPRTDYQHKICQADPLLLYQACLNELNAKLEGLQGRHEVYHDLQVYLHTQQHRLSAAGLLDARAATVAALLG